MSDSLKIMPTIAFIVARTFPDGIIGRNNEMPWHLGTDLRRFKTITSGHVMIMGRKTYISIGKPLPNRASIVLSRTDERRNDNYVALNEMTQTIYTNQPDDALFVADVLSIARGKSEIFVIGGAEMLNIFIKQVTKIYLTEIFNTGLSAKKDDAVFNFRFDHKIWKANTEEDHPKSDIDEFETRFTVLQRRERRYRKRYLSDFYTLKGEKDEWLAQQVKINRNKFEALPEQNDLF